MEKLSSSSSKTFSKFSKTSLLLAAALSSCTLRQNIQTNQIDIEKKLETELKDAQNFEQIFDILRKNGFEIGDISNATSCPKFNYGNGFLTLEQYQFMQKNPSLVQCGSMLGKQGLNIVSKTQFSKIFSTQETIRLQTANGRVQLIPDYFGTRILMTKKYE